LHLRSISGCGSSHITYKFKLKQWAKYSTQDCQMDTSFLVFWWLKSSEYLTNGQTGYLQWEKLIIQNISEGVPACDSDTVCYIIRKLLPSIFSLGWEPDSSHRSSHSIHDSSSVRLHT
jgi:hypothetical protein